MVVANAPVDLNELKARHPLGDVVEAAGVRLLGRGRVRQGVCPFHEETAPSFTVYDDSSRFYCFGCGAGGDILDFVQRTEGLTLPEAIRRLDGGTLATTKRPGAAVTTVASKPAPVPERDPALLGSAMHFYIRTMLRSPQAREYLASRGIGFDAAARLGLGYAPGHGLREYLRSARYDADRIQASGLFTKRGERFTGMVVVPDLIGGRVGWLVGRAVDPGVTPRFQALAGRKPVLGLSRLGTTHDGIVLVEGLFDWLALAQWGIPACAALGTQGMERVAAALKGRPRVFLAFDADDAGREATQRLQVLLGPRAAPVRLPEGSDVADLAMQQCWTWDRAFVVVRGRESRHAMSHSLAETHQRGHRPRLRAHDRDGAEVSPGQWLLDGLRECVLHRGMDHRRRLAFRIRGSGLPPLSGDQLCMTITAAGEGPWLGPPTYLREGLSALAQL